MSEQPQPKPVQRPEARPPSGIPARGYSWPPFEPGNQAALRHGGYAAVPEDMLARLRAELLEERPHLHHSSPGLVDLYLSVRVQRTRVNAWLLEHPVEESPSVMLLFCRLSARELAIADALGDTESAQARILEVTSRLRQHGHDVGGLEALAAEGRRALERSARRPEEETNGRL